jgi:hypothetical protein
MRLLKTIGLVWCLCEHTYLVSTFLREKIMPKEAVFTMKLEADLRADFMAETEAAHRSASQVMRELMCDFVQRQRTARGYDEFLNSKVETARTAMRAGHRQLQHPPKRIHV